MNNGMNQFKSSPKRIEALQKLQKNLKSDMLLTGLNSGLVPLVSFGSEYNSKEFKISKWPQELKPQPQRNIYEYLLELGGGLSETIQIVFSGVTADLNLPQIKIVLSQYELQNYLKGFDNISVQESRGFSSSFFALTLSRDISGDITVDLPLCKETLATIVTNQTRLQLPREVIYLIRSGQLKVRSECIFLPSNTLALRSSCFDSLFQDLQILTSSKLYKCPNPFPHREPRYASRDFSTPQLSIEDLNSSSTGSVLSKMISQDIVLNKLEITFLIGHQGSRIESIRQVSHATIKVLPIPQRLRSNQIATPSSVRQSICITGDLQSVATALSLIDYHLAHHRRNWKRKT